jgi:hypothetical protein
MRWIWTKRDAREFDEGQHFQRRDRSGRDF